MADYANGKIYCLKSGLTEKVYIGSTTGSLKKRLSCHEKDYRRYLKGVGKFLASFEILKCGDYKIRLLEHYPCLNRVELTRKEGEYIVRNLKAVNKNVAGRNNLDSCKAYYLKNRDLLRRKKGEIVKCSCMAKVTKSNLARHKHSAKHHEVDDLVETCYKLLDEVEEIVKHVLF